MSFQYVLPPVVNDSDSNNISTVIISEQSVGIQLQDGSVQMKTSSGHQAYISNQNLELFGRKVEEKIQESLEDQLQNDKSGSDTIAYQSLVELIESEDPAAIDLREQVTDGDPDYFIGAIKDNKHEFHAALPYFLRSAKRGNINSKYAIALYYYHGDLGYVDFNKCYEFLKDLVDADHGPAYYLLCQFYHRGLGPVQKDKAKAVEFAQKGAALGDKDSKFMMATYYHYGDDIQKDHQKAFALLKELEAVNHGSSEVCQLLGMYYLGRFGIERDTKLAFDLFIRAANAGCIEAYYPLGIFYFEGVDVKQDYDKAFACFQKAIKDSNPETQMYLAHCYYFGLGVRADKERARTIMSLFPPARYKESSYHLGCFAEADGEYHAAFAHFQSALKAKDIRAYGALGICYFLGQGTAVDYKKAFSLLRQVVFYSRETYTYIARCFAEGKGTTADIFAAIKNLETAVNLWPDAETHYKLAQLYMGKSQIQFSADDCEQIVVHLLAFLEMNKDPEDKRIPTAYFLLANFKQTQFREFGRSISDLNESVEYARKSAERGFYNSIILENVYRQFKGYTAQAMSISIKEREQYFSEFSALDFAQVMRYDLYMQKSFFDHYIDHPEAETDKTRYKHLKQIYTFLYEDLDREWGLLKRDQLRRLFKLNIKLMNFLLIHADKLFHAQDVDALKTSEPATAEEVADSFMPVMPKKKSKAAAKPKGAQNKAAPKKVTTVQQIMSAPKIIVPPAANQNRPPVVNPDVKTISPPKAAAVKEKASAPAVQSAEVKRVQKMLSIAQSFKAAQDAIVAHYSKDVSSSLRKSIEAVFDKKSLSQDKVIALMEHLADRENGSCVKNGNGGARLIVGDLSVGCHAFHGPGDKNHLGFIAELRKLMIALYQKKQ